MIYIWNLNAFIQWLSTLFLSNLNLNMQYDFWNKSS